MVEQRGRRKKLKRLADSLEIRVEPLGEQAFKDAGNLPGIPVPTWVRERLRQAAILGLEAAGHPIAFPEFPRGYARAHFR